MKKQQRLLNKIFNYKTNVIIINNKYHNQNNKHKKNLYNLDKLKMKLVETSYKKNNNYKLKYNKERIKLHNQKLKYNN